MVQMPAFARVDEGFLGLVLNQNSKTEVGVKGLASGASAQKAGVKDGDVIVAYMGKSVHTVEALIKAVKATAPGRTEKLTIKRDGKQIVFNILIVSRDTFLGAGIEALKGKKAPDLTVTNVLTQEKIELSKLVGTPVIIELWATWCPACVGNIPKLSELATKRKGHLRVLALSFEEPEKVRKFFSENKVSYDLVTLDPTNLNLSFMNNSSIPKFIIIDAKGVVVEITQSAANADEVLEHLSP